MKIDLISRAQLERVSRRRLKYPLQTAEKDYFLTLALLVIRYVSSSLRQVAAEFSVEKGLCGWISPRSQRLT